MMNSIDCAIGKKFWESECSHLLFNPRYSVAEQRDFFHIYKAGSEKYVSHIWVSTSGSSVQKWAGLSKKAFIISAQAVNAHLLAESCDVWVNPLPTFHVGGLSIYARAYMSGSVVYDYMKENQDKWNPHLFHKYLTEKKGTLSALVPTQLFDLCYHKLSAPCHLRAIVIGGGALSTELYRMARGLHWPILPSYGMTECASQIATASLESLKEIQFPPLDILPHMNVRQEEEILMISSHSLLTAYANLKEREVCFLDPKVEGWFKSCDRGQVIERCLNIYGREDSVFKIGGERVDFSKLEELLQTHCLMFSPPLQATLVVKKDERLGNSVHLVGKMIEKIQLSELIEKYNASVLPFERIRSAVYVEHIPMNSLGKIDRKSLEKLIDGMDSRNVLRSYVENCSR